ncbi:hypothetical protein P1P75_37530, partial [Streptomyces sp. ID05-39B]|uniref:hypothetical protein n=1 Tax=Streptomyces sp. ID05-39B TaxID=3028664 RepID=UPI0029AA0109
TPATDPADPAVPATVVDVDQALAATAVTGAERLAGLIAAAMLDTAGRPGKLPQYLYPDVPADQVRQIWQAALTVGYRAGRYATAPRFHRDTLARLQGELADAGHHAMARTVSRTLASIAAEPEPDHERTPTGGDETRGGHW